MKISKYLLYCLYSLVLILQTNTSYSSTVSILSDQWYPINGVPNSSHPGYMIEIAHSILKTHGHKLDYRLAPWKRSLSEVRQGNADCIVGAYKSDAPDFIFPAQAWGKAEFKFYVPVNSTWQYNGSLEVDDISLGVISGYTYSPELDRYISENKHTSKVQLTAGEDALELNIRKLMATRIDAIVSFEPVMENKLGKMNLSGKIKSAGALGPAQLMYIACSPKKASSQYYSELFSTGIVVLRKSGELHRILKKYGLKDWQ